MSQAIHAAMAAILADFPVVGKDRNNPHFKYAYRGIDDGLAALNPLLGKHKVYLQLVDLQPTFHDAGKGVRCILTGGVRFVSGEDGSFVQMSLAGEGMDSGDKALMKAQANGLKYVIWYTFAVPTEEKKDSEAFNEPDQDEKSKTRAKRSAPKVETKQEDEQQTQTGELSDAAKTMLEMIKSIKDGAQYLDKRPEVRAWVQARPQGDHERKLVVDMFVDKQHELGV